VISPDDFVNELREEIDKMQENYSF